MSPLWPCHGQHLQRVPVPPAIPRDSRAPSPVTHLDVPPMAMDTWIMIFFVPPLSPSVFSQAGQSQPAPAQQGMYNNMSITVSMAGGNTNVQNINPMAGQMQMNSLQMPGMNSMCSEQVSAVPAPLPGRSASSRGVQRSLLWPWGYRWLKRGAAKIWLSLLALPLCWSPRPPAPRGVLGGCRDVLSTSRPLGRLAAGPFVAVHPPELGKLGLGSGNG